MYVFLNTIQYCVVIISPPLFAYKCLEKSQLDELTKYPFGSGINMQEIQLMRKNTNPDFHAAPLPVFAAVSLFMK